MKKTILTAMLFFAFLVVGVQNVTAQYVTNDDATILLNAEVQAIYNNPNYTSNTTKDAQYQYLDNKVTFYTFVKDRIGAGETVATAIQQGVLMTNTTNSATSSTWVEAKPKKTPDQTPLHQEIIALLTL